MCVYSMMQDYHFKKEGIPNYIGGWPLGSPGYEKAKVDYHEFRDLMERVKRLEDAAGTCPCLDKKKQSDLAAADSFFRYVPPKSDELGNEIE